MTRDIVILGCGGLGRSVASLIDQINEASASAPWRLVGFLDDAASQDDESRVLARRNRVLGSVEAGCAELAGAAYVIGIGTGHVRERLAAVADSAGLLAATLIHHRANVGAGVTVGEGSIICAGATIDPDVTIGRHVLINKNSVTGHDSRLEDFVSIGPLAVVGGSSSVGHGATFGMHSMTIPGVSVGPGAVLGAAACAVRDVGPEQIVKGVPAT